MNFADFAWSLIFFSIELVKPFLFIVYLKTICQIKKICVRIHLLALRLFWLIKGFSEELNYYRLYLHSIKFAHRNQERNRWLIL